MDYGKLAYVKAEELSGHVSKLMAKDNANTTAYTTSPYSDFLLGDVTLSTVTGSGNVALFVQTVVRADDDVSGTLKLKINGMTCAEKAVSVVNGTVSEHIIMCSVTLDGTAILSLSLNGNATLLSAQVLLSGEGVKMSVSGSGASVDKCGELWAIADTRDNNVRVRSFDETNGTFGEEKYFGTGNTVSICSSGDGYMLAYTDEIGNIFVVSLTADIKERSRQYLGTGASKVAISRNGEEYIVAVINGGTVLCYVVGEGYFSMPISPLSETDARNIHFVTAVSPPMLVVENGARTYVKTIAAEYGGSEVISVTVTPSVTIA